MFKNPITAYRERQVAKADALVKAEVKRKKLKRSLLIELYTQCILNVMHIDSVVNVMNSMIHSIKGRNIGETKRRKTNIRVQVSWYLEKLKEEKFLMGHYSSLVEII